MRQHIPTASRAAALLIATLVVVNAGAAVAGAATPSPSTVPDSDAQPLSVGAIPPTQQNQTFNTTADNSGQSGGPSLASQVRINPDLPNENYVSAEVRRSDSAFNTTGAFTILSLSEPVEGVRIQQPKASARVLGGGQVIRVDYADDAAPRDQQSLYSLELFFTDGSKKVVELYATQTALSASTAIDPAWSKTINYIEENAESEGFDANPSGALEYVKYKEDRAQILENLWSDTAAEYVALKIAQSLNPFEWAEVIVILILISVFVGYKNGWILRMQQISDPISVLQREASRQHYEEQKRAAAKHPLSEVDGIGTNAARYWRDPKIGGGVETVDDMVEIAAKGAHLVDDNGHIVMDEDGNEVYAHRGVDDLRVDPLTEKALREKTWLRPMILEGRLNPATALANMEAALRVAEREYGRGNEVRETRQQVEELLRRLKGERDFERAESSSIASFRDMELTRDDRDPDSGSGAALGGD